MELDDALNLSMCEQKDMFAIKKDLNNPHCNRECNHQQLGSNSPFCEPPIWIKNDKTSNYVVLK